ncbi:MAG: 50S ribosomal protein L24 [Saprospiraceae bacterium]|nr:50S ribosomal protein L24 [Saprospiraceae bacterium]
MPKIKSQKLKIKKGDKVRVIAGEHKGDEGEVLEIQRLKNRAIVEGVNVAKKHAKPTNESAGGIRDINNPIHLSNLMLIDPKSGEPTRVGRREEDGKLVRFAKKSGETIK